MKIDHIHFYVEDASASRDWFVKHMGFQALASSVSRHTLTTAVKSNVVYIVLSSPLPSESPVAQFLRLHPPGVADIAFAVSDLEGLMEKAVANGAKVLEPVQQQLLAQGGWKWAKIAAWGSLSHTLTERTGNTPLLPAFLASEFTTKSFPSTEPKATPERLPLQLIRNSELFAGIDHVVLNVGAGDLELALDWYENVLGFQRQQRFMIQTDNSGLRSQVMVHPKSGLQLPINEPASANSQIQEFLDVNQGPGIQHIALETPQIVQAIAQLRNLGLSFLSIPPTYYTQLRLNYPGLPLSAAEFEEIAAQEILVDWQDKSRRALLLQTFTQPIFEQPTFFFELIERRQEAEGFGEGNFRALFEAIEREQMKRGSFPLGEAK